MELFEKDCAHTSEVIMSSLCKFENDNAFTLTDVNEELFDSSFLAVVARYLGGRVVDNQYISFMGKNITFEFSFDMIMYGFIQELEVIYYIS